MGIALMIDDDDSLVESYIALAEVVGVRLETAGTWDEGLSLFHVLDPDLVIVDYNLPGSRMGLRLLAEIRRLRPSVRLVLLSGFIDSDDARDVEALGLADRALTKSAPATVGAVRDELAAASALDRSLPLDWQRAATAHLRAAAVTERELDELDRLIMKRVPNRD